MRQFTGPDTTEPDAEYYVLGGNHVGEAVASRLHASGHDVVVVTDAPTATDLRTMAGDPTDLSTLSALGLSDAATVLVATNSDARNLLVAQLVRTQFDVPRTVVLTNDPEQMDAVKAAGHEPICATSAIADALVEDV